MLYTNSFTNKIKSRITYADVNGYTVEITDSLIEIVEDNMPVLVLTSSKDYIELLEQCTINMRYAIEYNDMQNVMIYKTLLLKTADEMNTLNKSPI